MKQYSGPQCRTGCQDENSACPASNKETRSFLEICSAFLSKHHGNADVYVNELCDIYAQKDGGRQSQMNHSLLTESTNKSKTGYDHLVAAILAGISDNSMLMKETADLTVRIVNLLLEKDTVFKTKQEAGILPLEEWKS